MTPSARALSASQRITLGSRLARMQKLLSQVRHAGFDSETIAELETAIERVKQETAAPSPPEPKHAVRGLLAEVLILTYEVRPRALKAYGSPLPVEAAAHLEQEASRLEQLAQRLLDEAERESGERGRG